MTIPYKLSKIIVLAFCLSSFVLSSCTKDEAETAYESQEKKISAYVENIMKNDTTGIKVSYNNGSTILSLTSGSGEGITKSSSIKFDYVAYTFNGIISNANIVATSDLATAKKAGLDISDPTIYAPVSTSIKDANFIQGLEDGLMGAKAGEQRLILFSGKYGYGKKKLGTISANSALAYQVLIEEVKN